MDPQLKGLLWSLLWGVLVLIMIVGAGVGVWWLRGRLGLGTGAAAKSVTNRLLGLTGLSVWVELLGLAQAHQLNGTSGGDWQRIGSHLLIHQAALPSALRVQVVQALRAERERVGDPHARAVVDGVLTALDRPS